MQLKEFLRLEQVGLNVGFPSFISAADRQKIIKEIKNKRVLSKSRKRRALLHMAQIHLSTQAFNASPRIQTL